MAIMKKTPQNKPHTLAMQKEENSYTLLVVM
jgi:hypothetical protein